MYKIDDNHDMTMDDYSPRNPKNYYIPDNYPRKDINQILPYSQRAQSLYARNKENNNLREAYLFISGAISMFEGLEYHFDNFVKFNLKNKNVFDLREPNRELFVKKLRSNARMKSINKQVHEAIAYINRLGQLYYFFISDFAIDNLHKNQKDIKLLIPKIQKIVQFRMKHAAHRAMDVPRGETQDTKDYLEIIFRGGLYDNDSNLMFQLNMGKGAEYDFNIIKDHNTIMNEAYELFQMIIKSK